MRRPELAIGDAARLADELHVDVAVGDVGLDLLHRAARSGSTTPRDTNGTLPPLARPAPTATMVCSAMPTLTSRSGQRLRKFTSLDEPTLSLTTVTMRGSASASDFDRRRKGVAAIEQAGESRSCRAHQTTPAWPARTAPCWGRRDAKPHCHT